MPAASSGGRGGRGGVAPDGARGCRSSGSCRVSLPARRSASTPPKRPARRCSGTAQRSSSSSNFPGPPARRRPALRPPAVPRRRGEKLASCSMGRAAADRLRPFPIPVDVGPMMTGSEEDRRSILAQLVGVVAELRRHDLDVLVTLYPPSLRQGLPETYRDGLDGPLFRPLLRKRDAGASDAPAIPRRHGGARADERAAVGLPKAVRPRLDRLPGIHDRTDPARSHPTCLSFLPAAAGRTSTASFSSTSTCCGTSATSSACISTIRSFSRIRPPTWTNALSRRHHRRALSGVGRQRRLDASSMTRERFETLPLPRSRPGAALFKAAVEIGRYFQRRPGPPDDGRNGCGGWRIGSSGRTSLRTGSCSPSSAR